MRYATNHMKESKTSRTEISLEQWKSTSAAFKGNRQRE